MSPRRSVALQDINSPLRPLLTKAAASPFNFAPERRTELKSIIDTLGVVVDVDVDVTKFRMEASVLLRRIRVGLPTLERLWAYAYAYVGLSALTRKHGMAKYIDLRREPEASSTRKLLLWAHLAELSGKATPWPSDCPRPDQQDQSSANLRLVNNIFFMMVGWILLHELGHIVLDHRSDGTLTSPEFIAQEYAADTWASQWVLARWDKYNPDIKIFAQRTMGIAYAISMISGIELYGEHKSPRTHPNVIDRLLRFFDTFVGETSAQVTVKEVAWQVPTAILQVHLMNIGKSVHLEKRYSTYRDYLCDMRQYFSA